MFRPAGLPTRFANPFQAYLTPPSTDFPQPRIHEMLGAFFGNSYRDWLLSQAKDSGYTSSYSNHWLVRKSAYEALSRGLVCLERQEPSMIEVSSR